MPSSTYPFLLAFSIPYCAHTLSMRGLPCLFLSRALSSQTRETCTCVRKKRRSSIPHQKHASYIRVWPFACRMGCAPGSTSSELTDWLHALQVKTHVEKNRSNIVKNDRQGLNPAPLHLHPRGRNVRNDIFILRPSNILYDNKDQMRRDNTGKRTPHMYGPGTHDPPSLIMLLLHEPLSYLPEVGY